MTPTKNIVIQKLPSLTTEQSFLLFGWSNDPFEGRQYGLQWATTGNHYVGFLREVPVCHVATLEIQLEVAGKSLCVVGFGGVITRPEAQRRGFAHTVMSYAANDNANFLQKNCGMLFCADKRLSYYEKLGWKKISNPVWVEQPQGECLMPLCAMILNPKNLEWPQGDIHALSLPW